MGWRPPAISPAPSDQRGSFPRHSPAFHTAPSFAAEGMHLRALLPAGDCHQERIPAVPGQEESPVRIRQLPERCSRQEQCLCLPNAGPDRGVGASLPHTMWAGSASRRSISSCLGSQSPSSVKPDMAHCSLEVRLPCGIVKAQHAGKALEAVGSNRKEDACVWKTEAGCPDTGQRCLQGPCS